MKDLITITPEGRTTSKDLYEFLQLDSGNYTRWCKQNIVENQFAEEGIDWGLLLPREEKLNYRPSQNYWLTIPFAKKLCMVSPTERGEQARNYFIEVENRHLTQQKQLATTDPLDLIISLAGITKELRQTQQQQGQEIKLLAAKMETRPVEYFTVAGFASLRRKSIDVNKANMLGRKAALLSREHGYEIGKTPDAKYGQVNTYHIDILTQVFDGEGQKELLAQPYFGGKAVKRGV